MPERQIYRPDVKIKNQYGAEPHYSTLPLWQLCALKGQKSRYLDFGGEKTLNPCTHSFRDQTNVTEQSLTEQINVKTYFPALDDDHTHVPMSRYQLGLTDFTA